MGNDRSGYRQLKLDVYNSRFVVHAGVFSTDTQGQSIRALENNN
jgi:hypothetical protein